MSTGPSPCPRVCAKAIVSTATQVSAIPAAVASNSGRARRPLANSPAAAIGTVIRPVMIAAEATCFAAKPPACTSGPSSATMTPTDATIVKIAGQQRRGSDRRASTLLSETLTSSEQPRTICTASSDPERSAAACMTKPPASKAAPSSHNGCRASSASNHGRRADVVGVRAACRCSIATPAP